MVEMESPVVIIASRNRLMIVERIPAARERNETLYKKAYLRSTISCWSAIGLRLVVIVWHRRIEIKAGLLEFILAPERETAPNPTNNLNAVTYKEVED